MLVDANELADKTTLGADLCIIGAGAAGVTLAHALRDTPLQIALFESGGIASDAPTQALYSGAYTGNLPGVDSSYLDHSRIRMYGGSTNLWGGYCRPLDPIDFEAREWVPDSGWPMSRKDLDPYYRAASDELGILPFDAPPPYLAGAEYPGHFLEGPLDERLYQLRYVNIGKKHLEAFKSSKKTKIHLHANAVDLRLNTAGTAIDDVRLATLSGKRATVRAKAYVLATGGIENARLLLASRGVHSKGVGNGNDLVGRYFMEHACVVTLGPMYAWKGVSLARYDVKVTDLDGGNYASPKRGTAMLVAPSEATIRTRQLLSATAQLTRVSDTGSDPKAIDESVMRACADIDGETARGGYAPPQKVALGFTSEQAPNRESRVKLGDAMDPLGLPQAVLDWRLGSQELDTLMALSEMIAAAAGSRRLGRVRLALGRDEILRAVGGGNHHMGTTRMSDDPKRGVVDSNCRVHGVDNLYVAGSSVFPTVGAANPTYTILALAFRLAEHLRGRLA